MSTRLSEHFEAVRIAQGLRPGDVATLAGYADRGLWGSRLKAFEQQGEASDERIARWAEALAIDAATISALEGDLRKDARATWEAWVSQPVPVSLVIRPFGGMWIGRPIPGDLVGREAIIDWVKDRCEYRSLLRCVLWNRRHSTYFRADGTSYDAVASFGDGEPYPFMSVV